MIATTDQTTTAAPALRVEGLIKRFGPVTALGGIDLELGPRELLALVGPSGCGKSTLLRALAGLVPADGGRIILGGEVVDDGRAHVPPEHRQIGLVFQEHALFPHLTVAANVAFGIRSGSRRDAQRRVGELLELVDLGAHGERYPHELSGGERQRIALARALAPRPALMLLDEPFASLDPNLRAQLRADVVTALRTTGTPAVFVTHDQTEALAVGDRVAVMRAGRIEQLADPATVFHQPVNQFVAAFMGEATFLAVRREGAVARTALGELDEVPAAGAVAMLRPDDVTFAADPQGDTVVAAAEFRGATWSYTLRLADGSEVLASSSHLDAFPVGARGRAVLLAGHRHTVLPTDG